MGNKFELIPAFSREGPRKVYVQHRLKERAVEVNGLLEKGASLYVCGDAVNMAQEVRSTLAHIIAEQRGISQATADQVVKQMRATNRYQVCSEFTLS